MNTLKLQNSLTREKQDFVPIDPEHIRIYACGPTVYNFAHIGNARMAVVFDLLANVLRTLYPKVTYVSNITDIDDKIINASRETGESCDDITCKYADIYNDDMASLGVTPPDVQPRATKHIPQMIALIEKLIENGNAYEAEGHVLFNVPSFPAYGGLSGRGRDDQIAGARVEVAPYKKDPADFVLWKPSTKEQPGWDSPWGRGRPGWHIECSAMAEKHLGLPFDIHGGGADLKFPHHENEIAQSCCAHETDDLSAFAKYWVHNGFVTVSGEKMSKSLGNITLANELLEHYDGEVLRFALLSAHYSQPLDWTEKLLKQVQTTLERLYKTLADLEKVKAKADKAIQNNNPVLIALCDDLNTPKAIAELNALAKTAAKTQTPEDKTSLLYAAKLLGVLQNDPEEFLGYGQEPDDIDSGKIEALLEERQDARKNRDFARADEIRDELTDMGIVIEDSPDGPKWKKA